MGQVILTGNPSIEIELRRSARSRRLSLRVSRLDGRVTLSVPLWTSHSEAAAFAREKEHWIRKNIDQRPTRNRPEIGAEVLFQGQLCPILPSNMRSVRYEDGTLLVPGDVERSPARLAGFMKQMARQRLATASDHYSQLLGQKYGRITIRDTRSRWGSCTTDGNLMYSWRLIMAPPEVLNYVAAHEVSHLVEMNHSPAFWGTVEGIFPHHASPRKWLRRNGQQLHSYQFTD